MQLLQKVEIWRTVPDGNNHLDGEVSSLSAKAGDVSGLKEALPVPVRLRVGDPDGLLGVVRLVLVRPLALYGGKQELRGVGVSLALLQLYMTWHSPCVLNQDQDYS